MRKRYFDDLEVGETKVSEAVEITAEEIIEFATRFDPQPFHTDPVEAKKSFFKGLVASGTHTIAYWRRLDHEINGDIAFICGLEYEHIKLHRPLRAGDQMHLKTKLIEKLPSRSDPARGIVKFEYFVYNQSGELLASIKSTSLVARQ